MSESDKTFLLRKTSPNSSYFTFVKGGYIIRIKPIAIGMLVVPTETPVPFTPTLEPSPTVVVTPTILYPEGSHYTLFYNETSLYMLNRSYETRTISAFFFERLDGQGLPAKDQFDGYRWETPNFDYLPRNFCVNVTIYGDQDPPYLDPIECWAGIISTIQARFDRPFDVLFWTPKEGSTQFRVLWLDEEVARCEIAAGVCEVYIP